MEQFPNANIFREFGVLDYHNQGIYGKGIKIYVIDTGLNFVNQDLAHVIVEDFTGAYGSESSHGSAVCSLLSARINEFGVIGVAPEAEVYLADVDTSDTSIYESTVVQAFYQAYMLHVDIISVSLSTTQFSMPLYSAIKLCTQAGILVFAAAGNSSRYQYEYPSSFDGVLSVASCTERRQLSNFTTRNDKISVVAPGENFRLPDTIVNGQIMYKNFSGTSFSTPFAAGLAALELCKRRLAFPQDRFIVPESAATFVVTQMQTGPLLATVSVGTSESTTITLAISISIAVILILAVLVYAYRNRSK